MSANNHARDEVVEPNDPPIIEIQRYPAMFGDPYNEYGGLSNMTVVGTTDWKTQRWVDSNYSPYVATFAPGENVHSPADKFMDNGEIMRTGSGTSYGKLTNGSSNKQLVSHGVTNMGSPYLSSRPSGRRAGQLLPISAISLAVSAGQAKQRQEAHPALCAPLCRIRPQCRSRRKATDYLEWPGRRAQLSARVWV